MWKLYGVLFIASNVFGMDLDRNKMHFKKAYKDLKFSEQIRLANAIQDLIAGEIPGFTLDSEKNPVRFKSNQGLVVVTVSGIACNIGLTAFVGYHKEMVDEKKKANFKFDDLQNILFDDDVLLEKDIKEMQGDNRIYFKTPVN